MRVRPVAAQGLAAVFSTRSVTGNASLAPRGIGSTRKAGEHAAANTLFGRSIIRSAAAAGSKIATACFESSLARARTRTRVPEASLTAEARGVLDSILGQHPGEPLLLSERGQLALAEGQPGQAERWLRQAVNRMPANRQAVYALAQALRQLGRDDEARRYDERVKEIENADLIEHLEEGIAAATKRLNSLKRKMSTAASEARTEWRADVEKLGNLRHALRIKVADLRAHGAQTGHKAREQAEKLWAEINDAMQRLAERVRH